VSAWERGGTAAIGLKAADPLLIVGRFYGRFGVTLHVVVHEDTPRPAAYLAVLDVVLRLATAGVERQDVLLAAVGAADGRFGVGCAVAEGIFFVEIFVVIGHGSKIAGGEAARVEGRGSRVEGRGLRVKGLAAAFDAAILQE